MGQLIFGQTVNNIDLKRQLDSIMVLDQKYREILSNMSDSLKKDSTANAFATTSDKVEMKIWEIQSHIDSSNLVFIENIFKQYGYPGKSLVGQKTNEVAWYVIQHSPKIKQYFFVIKEAAKKKELPFKLVAMMEDRLLMEQGKEQIYGTQGTCRQIKNGQKECFIWPIKDPKNVNKRRKEAGLDLTVEKNAERLNMKYRVVKLSEVQ